MFAILAAVAFLIGMFIAHPDWHTLAFWTVLGLILVACHLAFSSYPWTLRR